MTPTCRLKPFNFHKSKTIATGAHQSNYNLFTFYSFLMVSFILTLNSSIQLYSLFLSTGDLKRRNEMLIFDIGF